MKKTVLWALFVFIIWGVFWTCDAARTTTVTDMVGRKVTTPSNPERIVCLGPGTLRLIVYLQAESKVVGVEDMEKMNPGGRPYWLAHTELSTLPRCGPGGPAGINKKPDFEAVLSVNPEVVFVTYMEKKLADTVQQTLGIPVVVLSYGAFATFDEAVFKAIEIAGTVLNRQGRAKEVIAYIASLRTDLDQRTANLSKKERPRVYVGGIGYRGAYGIESTEQQYIPFDWVNADNVADQVTADAGSHVFMDKEMLLKLNPDIIFIDGGGLLLVADDYRKKADYYGALSAFSTRQVYALLPFNWYVTNIDTALADAYAIGKILYKKQFEDIDPEQKTDEIYTYLVGKPVYQKMKEAYGPIGQRLSFSD